MSIWELSNCASSVTLRLFFIHLEQLTFLIAIKRSLFKLTTDSALRMKWLYKTRHVRKSNSKRRVWKRKATAKNGKRKMAIWKNGKRERLKLRREKEKLKMNFFLNLQSMGNGFTFMTKNDLMQIISGKPKK